MIYINLSLKKSGSSFVHNIFRLNGSSSIHSAPEKEYYVFPRKATGFYELASSVSRDYDPGEGTYFSSGLCVSLTREDKVFLSRLIERHVDHVNSLHLNNVESVLSDCFSRLRYLSESYSSGGLIVSDPNFLIDLVGFTSTLGPESDRTIRELISDDRLAYFSVVRHPVKNLLSLMAMHIAEGVVKPPLSRPYIKTLIDRSKFFHFYDYLNGRYGLTSSFFRFDDVIKSPLTFYNNFCEHFGLELGAKLGASIENPNPGIKLPEDFVDEVTRFVTPYLTEEVERYESIPQF